VGVWHGSSRWWEILTWKLSWSDQHILCKDIVLRLYASEHATNGNVIFACISSNKMLWSKEGRNFQGGNVSICLMNVLMSNYSSDPVPPKKCFQLTIPDRFSGSLVIHNLWFFYKFTIRSMLNHVHLTLTRLTWELDHKWIFSVIETYFLFS
jgi:hypothetical protein